MSDQMYTQRIENLLESLLESSRRIADSVSRVVEPPADPKPAGVKWIPIADAPHWVPGDYVWARLGNRRVLP